MVVDTEPEINIKSLVLEEPQREYRPFNSETDLTSQDWTTMTRALQQKGELALDPLQPEDLAVDFFGVATQVKLVDPQKFRHYFANTQDFLLQIRRELEEAEEIWDWSNMSEYAYELKTLSPQQVPAIESTDALVQDLLETPTLNPNKGWFLYASDLMHLKVVNPDLVPESAVDDQSWEEIRQKVNQALQQEDVMGIYAAAAMRVISPSRWQAAQFPDLVPSIKRQMGELRQQGLAGIFAIGAAAKIITAQEVIIGPGGLELRMPNLTLAAAEQPPEPRSF